MIEKVSNSIKDTTPLDKIKRLRKMKTLPVKVKVALYAGCREPLAASQFHTDLNLYGLWEALLYVQNGEPKYYRTGTAKNCINAIV